MLKFLILVSWAIVCNGEFDINLAKVSMDYFDFFHIKHAQIFVCGSLKDSFTLFKFMSKANNVMVNFQNLDQFEMRNCPEKIINRALKSNYAFVIDLECANSELVLKKAESKNIFDILHKWLVIGNDFEKSQKILQKLNFRLDTNLKLAIRVKSFEESWLIFDVYNPDMSDKNFTSIKAYGKWKPFETNRSDLKGQNSKWTPLSYESDIILRSNLRGISLNAAIVINYQPPDEDFIHYLSTLANIDLDTMHRYNYALFTLLMDMFNFKINIIRSDGWGANKNGTWSGIIGALWRRQAEVAITPTEVTIERLKVVDQSAIVWFARPCLIFKHPRGGVGLGNNFLRPLSGNAWKSTIGVLVIIVLALRLSGMKMARRQNDVRSEYSWSYLILLCTTGGMAQQGFSYVPDNVRGRMIIFTLLTFSFTLYQFYSASIVSSLLMDPPKTITKLDDLVRSPLRVLIEDIPYNYEFFERTKSKTALELYDRKILPIGKNNAFVPPEYGLKMVLKGGYAFQMDVAYAYKRIPMQFDDRSICDLTEIELFPPKSCTTALRKGSAYRQHITYGLRKLQSSGLMQYQRSHWHSQKPRCPLEGSSTPESVTMPEMATAFVVLGVGFVAALLVFIAENF